MSGGRQTGTVPKTKHNSRARRENPVNHLPNNLDWHETYAPQRVRKESNTNTRLSDAGDPGFIYEENPWVGLAPSNRTDDDELRWSNVKSSNITPERGNSAANVDGYLSNRTMQIQDNNGPEEREIPGTSKETMSRGRLKLKMEQSHRKIEELQQTQAALLSLRNKAIQQVKPVQMEDMQQHSGLLGLRNKAIQQVKPVQVEMDRMTNMEARIQTMQDYASIMQALERDETATNLVEPADLQCDQQLRIKLNELLAKKAQCDTILACIESETLPGNLVGAGSVSSDDGEASQFSRTRQGFGEIEEVGSRRDVNKQDNRELEHHTGPSNSYLHNKELKLEEVKNKLEQLQTLLNRVESLREGKPTPRMNGDGQSHGEHSQPACKNCPPNSVLEKLQTKKMDLNPDMRKVKAFQGTQGYHYNQPAVESWTSSVNGATGNSVDYSSEEGDVDYDESPVKLCPTSYMQPNSFSKASTNGHQPAPKVAPGPARESRRGIRSEVRQRPPRVSEVDMRELVPNTTSLAEQISELQIQMEQMQILYQGMLEKQQVVNFSSPQPWIPQPNLGFMQFMGPPTPQWHQHQLLINSLNQCCQLIWHQQRELAGLRQALAMIQEEGRMYKCGGYGNNLNFDPSGLLWAQSSPQTLNNQVPPGNRANNYWDNFRSYSRQNLLSGRNKSNEGSIAESLPAPRPSAQTDNLRRRKENHSLGNAQVNGTQMHSGEISGSLNSCRSRRRYNSNLKADATAVFSLEQSIYSELETVIAQAERSPQLLLQLLTQLKNLRSQRPSPYEEGNPVGFENECELLDHGIHSYPNPNLPSRMEEARNHHVDCRRKRESVLEDVSRLIERQESETCTSDVISEIVGYLCRTLALDGNMETALLGALSKYKGTRMRPAAGNILCTIAQVLVNPGHQTGASMNELNDNGLEQEEEEGAVGGISLAPPPQQPKAPSVEAELAEADQTQCNSADNVEVFGVDETGLPNIELDNQELPPREENQEQPLQEP